MMIANGVRMDNEYGCVDTEELEGYCILEGMF